MRVNYTPEEIAEMHDRNENFNGTRADGTVISAVDGHVRISFDINDIWDN